MVIKELCVLNYSFHRMSDSRHIPTYIIHQISDGTFRFMQKMSDSEHIYIYTYFIHQCLTGKKKYPLAASAKCLTGNTAAYFIQKMSDSKTHLLTSFRKCLTGHTYLLTSFRKCLIVKHIYLLHSENV